MTLDIIDVPALWARVSKLTKHISFGVRLGCGQRGVLDGECPRVLKSAAAWLIGGGVVGERL